VATDGGQIETKRKHVKVQEVKLKYIRLTGHDTCTHEPYRSADTNTMIRRLDLFVLDPPRGSQSESVAALVFVFLFKKFTVQSVRRPDSARR
jgi:hypothetical protein